MNTYIVEIAYTPKGAPGLRLSATVASMGLSAEDIVRRWTYKHRDEVLADTCWSKMIQVRQDGELTEFDMEWA